MTADMAYPL